MIFVYQRQNEIKQLVVFSDIHAMGKAAWMNRSISSNIDRSVFKGLTCYIYFRWLCLFMIGMENTSFYLKLYFVRFLKHIIIIPWRDDKKSFAAYFPGFLFGSFYLVFVMLKQDKLPVCNAAGSSECSDIFDNFIIIRTGSMKAWVSSKPSTEKTMLPFLKNAPSLPHHFSSWTDPFVSPPRTIVSFKVFMNATILTISLLVDKSPKLPAKVIHFNCRIRVVGSFLKSDNVIRWFPYGRTFWFRLQNGHLPIHLDEISILSALISVSLSITLLMFIVFALLSKFQNKVKILTKHHPGSWKG